MTDVTLGAQKCKRQNLKGSASSIIFFSSRQFIDRDPRARLLTGQAAIANPVRLVRILAESSLAILFVL